MRGGSSCGGGEVQGGEEAVDLGFKEPDPLAEDGRPVLLGLQRGLGCSQLLLDGYYDPLRQFLLQPYCSEGGGGGFLAGPGARRSRREGMWRGRRA